MGNTFLGHVVAIIGKYGMWFLQGMGTTLLVALTGTIIGFFLGLLVGVVRTIPIPKAKTGNALRRVLLKIVNFILNCYIEIFRGTPMIVQAIIIYYGLMEAYGINLPSLAAGILVISINTGAYMAEVVRGGIESIDVGQMEAAKAIGMNHGKAMINIILPQAIRNILPATGNEFVINIKDSAVLNVISVTELYFMSKSIKGALFMTYEVFLITCAIYLVMTIAVTRILRLIERKMDGPSGYTVHSSSTMPNSKLKVKDRSERGGLV